MPCPGYGARPLKWRSHQPSLSTKSRDSTDRGSGEGPRKRTELGPSSLKFDHLIDTAHEAVQYCEYSTLSCTLAS